MTPPEDVFGKIEELMRRQRPGGQPPPPPAPAGHAPLLPSDTPAGTADLAREEETVDFPLLTEIFQPPEPVVPPEPLAPPAISERPPRLPPFRYQPALPGLEHPLAESLAQRIVPRVIQKLDLALGDLLGDLNEEVSRLVHDAIEAELRQNGTRHLTDTETSPATDTPSTD